MLPGFKAGPAAASPQPTKPSTRSYSAQPLQYVFMTYFLLYFILPLVQYVLKYLILPLLSLLLSVPATLLCTPSPLILSNTTKDIVQKVMVGRAFAFQSGRRRYHFVRATARHRIRPPMFQFRALNTPATVCVPVLGRHIFLLGGTAFFRNQIRSRPSVHWPLSLQRDDIPSQSTWS